jgi:hypothetical protein
MTTIAMKVYDIQWFTTFRLDYTTAAAELRQDGVDTVLTQNRIDPLPNSGVDQETYLANAAERMAGYDDRAWVEALRAEGLRTYQTTATFFDPAALAVFPDAQAVDANGQPDRGFDWYVGICPTHHRYLAAKIERLRRVVATLQPDGLFLSFTRFPGFWENWTWAPDYVFSAADRFCFCDRCRHRFAVDRGIHLPGGTVADQSRFVLEQYGEAWTAWRCSRITKAVERIVSTVRQEQPALSIMLNSLPFPSSDFGNLDVRREIAAQDLGQLATWVDQFELMTYLQILNRPTAWLRSSIEDARRLLPSGRNLLCTLQVSPLYTEHPHASRSRSPQVMEADLEVAAQTALESGADGLVFYHWTDFLINEQAGGQKRRVLRSITHGS